MNFLEKGGWVGLGQVGAAIGQLAGIRFITEFISPKVFGEGVLLIGFVSLITTTLFNPLMQALLRYYPDAVKSGTLISLQETVEVIYKRKLVIALILSILLGVAFIYFMNGSLLVVLALMALIVLDSTRMKAFAFYNGAHRHKPYSIWTLLDAWLRPMFAILMFFLLGEKVESLLLGYAIGALIITLIMNINAPAIIKKDSNLSVRSNSDIKCVDLGTYMKPLVPLGIIGWVSGIADRYVIASLVGMTHVGVYSAIYGLTAKPMLMISNIIETVIRPLYYDAVAENNKSSEYKFITVWIMFTTLLSISVLITVLHWHKEIVYLLLAEEYRDSSFLMPWIASGYVLLALSHIFTRTCYAKHKTQGVLSIELMGAITSVVISVPFIYFWGIYGAAIAVPVYMGFQFIYSLYEAFRPSKI